MKKLPVKKFFEDFFGLKMSNDDRRQRFDRIAKKSNMEKTFPLLLSKKINEADLQRINLAISALLEKYAIVVMKKTPITPVIEHLDENHDLLKEMSKKLVGNCLEVCDDVKEEYKVFHNAVCDGFAKLDLSGEIDVIQSPVNLRLKIGDYDSRQEHRDHPLSTSKAHIDMWAGAPACLTICITELINHGAGSKIEFREIKKFPKSLARCLGSYDSKAVTRFLAATEENKVLSKTGFWNFVDTYTPHQTIYRGRGVRISTDFRFSWKEKLPSDFIDHQPPGDFKKYEDWKL